MSKHTSAFAGVLLGLAGLATAATPKEIEQRVSAIQQLAPAVVVNGETPATKSLADRMVELKVPGVSVAVIHQGRIEWARGFGVARVGGPPVSENTLFQAASISKPVFALAALHLVDAGKLKLDANVNDYLETWKLPDNEFTATEKVTLRRLLSHSAGLTVHGFPGYDAGAKLPSTVQILDGTPPTNTAPIRVDVLPGSMFRYSGGGYVLAQQLLADVTGVPLPKLMQDTVLGPLGMKLSTYEQPLPAKRLSEIATPYRGDGSPVAGGPHSYPEMAPAGLWTTPSDLARYALGVQAALEGKSKVISAATARAMVTRVLGEHGIGPAVGGKTARKFFTHGGANEGYRCLLVAYEDGEGAVVMTNSDNGDALMGDLMRTIAHVYHWPDFAPPVRTVAQVKPESLDKFMGVYELNDGSLFVVRKKDGRLIGNVVGNTPNDLLPASDHELFARDADILMDFSVDANGVPTSVRHHRGDWQRNGPRAGEARAREVLASLEKADQRFKEQKPRAGSEAAIRKLFAAFAENKPNYEDMGPRLAQITRQQVTGIVPFVQGLGELKGLAFQRVSEAGSDVYHVDFANGGLKVDINLSDEGKIEDIGVMPR